MLETILRDFDEFLGCFVDQPLDGALVVSCEDMASGLVHAAIDGFDESRAQDVGLVFSAPVDDIHAYVTEVAMELREALREADQLHTDGDDPPIPEAIDSPAEPGLPSTVPPADGSEAALLALAEDRTKSPAARLEALIRALLLRLPTGDYRLLIALNPARIVDHAGYQTLLEELLPLRVPGLRLVLRDQRPPAHLPPDFSAKAALEGHPSQHLFDFPIDFEFLVASTRATADDPRQPPLQRVSAQLQVGFYESGHGSTDEAEQHFLRSLAELGELAQRAELPDTNPGAVHLESLALYGLGTIRAKRGEAEDATQLLSRSWTLAEGSAPSVKVPIALGLGRALVALEEFDKAAVFLSLASSYAAEDGANDVSATSLRELGDVQMTLGHRTDALEAWSLARQILSVPTSKLARDLDRLLGRSSQG